MGVVGKCGIEILATGFCGFVRGMYGPGSVVRSVVRTGSTPYQART